jgi:Family of unknown function (DUF6152)
MNVKSSLRWIAVCWFSVVALPTLAHHSFATFDMTKQITLTGTVREFQWQNPHIWIYLVVKDGEKTQEWGVEGGSLVGLKRDGWMKDDFKPGDKVTVTIHPKRDGTYGGSFVEGTTAGGKKLGKPNETQVTSTPKTP